MPKTAKPKVTEKPVDETAQLREQVETLQKAFNGVQRQLTANGNLAETIQAAAFLANAGRSSSRQNPSLNSADASLAPGDYPAFNFGGFMSPANPVLPIEPEVAPRQFQYAPGVNLRFIPRMGYGLLDFATLRSLSYACKEIRLNVEKVKSTIRGIEHEITVDKKTVTVMGADYSIDPKIVADVQKFWEKPDGKHDFDDWVNMALEELLVTDALCIYPEPFGRKRVRLVDGTTIRPTTSYQGEIPDPPAPAYIQVLYGYPRWWCTADRMYYLPMRGTVNSPYGTSPIEYIIQTMLAAIKKDSSLLANFTEGNVPAAFAGLPSTWTPEQIQAFTEWYNTIIQGDNARRFKLMFIPHDSGGLPVQNLNADDINQTALSEFLMTIACWAYGNDKTEFGIISGQGLGGKGAMQGGENAQVRGMIQVYTRFLSRLINAINRDYLGAPWAKSRWIGMEPPEDELQQAQIDQIYVGIVYTADYVADRLGIPDRFRIKAPIVPPTPEGYVPSFQAAAASAASTPDKALPFMRRAIEADLLAWRDRAVGFAKKGFVQTEYTAGVMPDDMRKAVFALVAKATTPEEVKDVFSDILENVRQEADAMQKNMAPVKIDPATHIKQAAEQDLEHVMNQWLEDVAKRIVSHQAAA